MSGLCERSQKIGLYRSTYAKNDDNNKVIAAGTEEITVTDSTFLVVFVWSELWFKRKP